MIHLTIPLPPSANQYWRTRVILPKGGKTPFASTYVSSEAAEYKNNVRTICIQNRIRALKGDIVIALKVYRKIKRGDLDNRIKVCLDSLQGFAYDDDEQIVKILAERHDDHHNPRVEVWIDESSQWVEQMKFFDNLEVPF